MQSVRRKERRLQQRLVELAFSIPPRYKFRWKHDDLDTSGLLFSDEISEVFDTPKISLKRTFEDQLPHDFLYRRKKGFRVRLIDWFGSIFRDQARDMLLVDRSTKRGMYNAPKLNKILTENEPSGNDARAMNVSILTNLGLFSSPHIDAGSSARSV